MASKKLSIFKQIVNRKGWNFAEVGERWGVSERQMSRIANSGNQRDIDAANGLPNLLEENMSELASYLGITDSQLHALDLELHEDMGSSGEMVYSYYFRVPEHTPPEILELAGWTIGQLINGIPINVVEEDDSKHDEDDSE